jgi:hypothetical protein
MPSPKTVVTALITTAIALAIIWRVPQLRKLVLGE